MRKKNTLFKESEFKRLEEKVGGGESEEIFNWTFQQDHFYLKAAVERPKLDWSSRGVCVCDRDLFSTAGLLFAPTGKKKGNSFSFKYHNFHEEQL